MVYQTHVDIEIEVNITSVVFIAAFDTDLLDKNSIQLKIEEVFFEQTHYDPIVELQKQPDANIMKGSLKHFFNDKFEEHIMLPTNVYIYGFAIDAWGNHSELHGPKVVPIKPQPAPILSNFSFTNLNESATNSEDFDAFQRGFHIEGNITNTLYFTYSVFVVQNASHLDDANIRLLGEQTLDKTVVVVSEDFENTDAFSNMNIRTSNSIDNQDIDFTETNTICVFIENTHHQSLLFRRDVLPFFPKSAYLNIQNVNVRRLDLLTTYLHFDFNREIDSVEKWFVFVFQSTHEENLQTLPDSSSKLYLSSMVSPTFEIQKVPNVDTYTIYTQLLNATTNERFEIQVHQISTKPNVSFTMVQNVVKNVTSASHVSDQFQVHFQNSTIQDKTEYLSNVDCYISLIQNPNDIYDDLSIMQYILANTEYYSSLTYGFSDDVINPLASYKQYNIIPMLNPDDGPGIYQFITTDSALTHYHSNIMDIDSYTPLHALHQDVYAYVLIKEALPFGYVLLFKYNLVSFGDFEYPVWDNESHLEDSYATDEGLFVTINEYVPEYKYFVLVSKINVDPLLSNGRLLDQTLTNGIDFSSNISHFFTHFYDVELNNMTPFVHGNNYDVYVVAQHTHTLLLFQLIPLTNVIISNHPLIRSHRFNFTNLIKPTYPEIVAHMQFD